MLSLYLEVFTSGSMKSTVCWNLIPCITEGQGTIVFGLRYSDIHTCCWVVTAKQATVPELSLGNACTQVGQLVDICSG
jgi:hypothetical protein